MDCYDKIIHFGFCRSCLVSHIMFCLVKFCSTSLLFFDILSIHQCKLVNTNIYTHPILLLPPLMSIINIIIITLYV